MSNARLLSQIGSLLAIMAGLLVVLIGVQLAQLTRSPAIYALYASGTAVATLGVFGLLGRWVAILVNAVLCTAMAGLCIVVFVQRSGRIDALSSLVLVLTVLSAVLLWLGLPNARRLARFS